MSTKRMAVIAAVSSYTSHSNTTSTTYFSGNSISGRNGDGGFYSGHQTIRPGALMHGNVNVLLASAMLSVVIAIVCIVCYCCHQTIKKRPESIYRERWPDNDPNMEIYNVEQCFESSGLFAEMPCALHRTVQTTGLSDRGVPPPSYESLLARDEIVINNRRSSPPPQYNLQDDSLISVTCHKLDENRTHLTSTTRPHGMDGNPFQNTNEHLVLPQVCSDRRNRVIGNESVDLNDVRRKNLFQSARPINEMRANCDTNSPTNNNNSNDDISNNNEIYFNHNCDLCGRTVFLCESSPSIGNFENINPHAVKRCDQRQNYMFGASLISRIRNANTSTMMPSDSTDVSIQNLNDNSQSDNCNLLNALRASDDQDTSAMVICSTNQQLDESDNNNNNENKNNDEKVKQTVTSTNLETFDINGVIRMDMSRIIDHTGLPTYEAALKLESSGYV